MNFFKRVKNAAVGTVTDTVKTLAPKKLSELPGKLFVAPLTVTATVAAKNVKALGVGGKLGGLATKVDARVSAVQTVADEHPVTVVKGVGAVAATVAAFYTGGSTAPLAAKLYASTAQDVLGHEAQALRSDAGASTVAPDVTPQTGDVAQPASATTPTTTVTTPAAPQLTFFGWLKSLGRRP